MTHPVGCAFMRGEVLEPVRDCTKCKQMLPATSEYFSPQPRGKFGLHSWCRACVRAGYDTDHHRAQSAARQRQRTARRLAGITFIKEMPTHRRCPHCERTLLLSPEFFHRNAQDSAGYLYRCKTCERSLGKKYRDKNAGKRRVWIQRAHAKRYANPTQKLSARMSCSVGACLPRGAKRRRRWETLVGYTVEQLREHLAKQFAKGMSFENYGKWHVDHIVPVKCFNFETYEDPDFQACWALSNLRPLWKQDNLQKQAIRTHLI